MYLFTAVEAFNKVSGFFVLAIIARLLGEENFSTYLSILIIFGYCIEFASFSYQSKNLIECQKNNSYFSSEVFAVRTIIVLFTSVIASFFLFFSSLDVSDFSIVPLCIILLFSAFTFDFWLYANGKSNNIVLFRFVSQFSLLFILLIYQYFGSFEVYSVFYLNLISSSILFVLVLFSVFFQGKGVVFSLFKRLKKIDIKVFAFKHELINQIPIFILKITVLFIVTVEVPISIFFDYNYHENLAVGHRVCLILLPFLIFFLNSNAKEVVEGNLIGIIVLSSIFSSVLVITAPVIIFSLFGEGYQGKVGEYSCYFFVLVFQSFVNYYFYLAIKDDASMSINLRFLFVIIFCFTSFYIANYFGVISSAVFLFFSVAKASLIVIFSKYKRFADRGKVVILIILPLLLSLFLDELGYYESCSELVLDFSKYINRVIL
ncbi:hypothetical protein [Pseudoalteromonas sp. A25]|uniref:hypothetical protein n=1 Tax=Pseudoalteromonas sp. A25 TaxID=116092 RepID=UPI001260AAF1|nr:hypothetical protein [Pseudoalteromonas sp. A25]